MIDPVSAYMGQADSNKNSDVRAVLSPLADLAARSRVAILLVTHLRKDEGAALYRSMGSLGFVAAARAAWLICRDKDDEERRLMVSLKNNLAPDSGNGLAFRVTSRSPGFPPRIKWCPGPITISADEALAPVVRKRGPKDVKGGTAIIFLKEQLRDGPQPAETLKKKATELGIEWRTLQRAFGKLQGSSSRNGFGGKVTWALPPRKSVTSAPGPKNLSSKENHVINGQSSKKMSLTSAPK